MIESLMCNTCKIWRRKKTGQDCSSSDGTAAGDKFDLFDGNAKCKFIDKIGKTIPNDGTGRDIVLDGEFRTVIEILATDKIEFNGYDYIVSEVQEKCDIITEKVQYYRSTVTRQLKANTNRIAVK